MTGIIGLLALLACGAAPKPKAVVQSNDSMAPGLRDRLLQQVDTYASTRWRFGLAVVSCRDRQLLFGYNATTALSPASNQKLLVTTCALRYWNDSLVVELDRRLDTTPTRKHLRAANPRKAESLGLNAHPEFPGYRHLVLANRESDNIEAEWMLELLSAARRTTLQQLIVSFLDTIHVLHPGLRVADGCGLARRNRVTPLTLATLLAETHRLGTGALFRSTLAVPNLPGTLIHRPLDTGPRVAAKTGFIRDVFALSGYLSAEADTYAFSFIINGCGSGTRAYRLFNGLLSSLCLWDIEGSAGPGTGPSQTLKRN